MSYSQKYCLAAFTKPPAIGSEFHMTDWPLHITLADVFAIDLVGSAIEAQLSELTSKQLSIKTHATNTAILGTTDVMLVEANQALVLFHTDLIDLLEKNGAVFNNPEFTRNGFLPHCTIQKSDYLKQGEEVAVTCLTLIDLFPNGDWQKRKVMSNFELASR